jgi:hypothetical protein
MMPRNVANRVGADAIDRVIDEISQIGTDAIDRAVNAYAPPPARALAIRPQRDIAADLDADTDIEKIRRHLRLLTHRQMREIAADIFGAYERLHPKVDSSVLTPAIPSSALAETLDRFAHGD